MTRLAALGLTRDTTRIFAGAPIFFLSMAGLPFLAHPAVFRANPTAHFTALSFVLAEILAALATAPLLARATALVAGRPLGLDGALREFRGRLLPVVGVTILQLLALMGGLALLVVPGLVTLVVFALAGPACLDGAAPIVALRRSLALTRGSRWQIAGAMLIAHLPLLALLGLQAGLRLSLGHDVARLVYVRLAVEALGDAWTTILGCVAYGNLRGGDRSRLAEVFT